MLLPNKVSPCWRGGLNSDAAVKSNFVIMRAFVQMRNYLATTPDTLAARLESIDRRLLELEQTRIAGELGLAREPALLEHLSAEVRVQSFVANTVFWFFSHRFDSSNKVRRMYSSLTVICCSLQQK